jgi:phosphoribosylformylglycinamidine cyclo-ligase
LNRILPEGMDAVIDAGEIRIPKIFSFIKEESGNDDADMIKTFNVGCGLAMVVSPEAKDQVIEHMEAHGIPCNQIGVIKAGGTQSVKMEGALRW